MAVPTREQVLKGASALLRLPDAGGGGGGVRPSRAQAAAGPRTRCGWAATVAYFAALGWGWRLDCALGKPTWRSSTPGASRARRQPWTGSGGRYQYALNRLVRVVCGLALAFVASTALATLALWQPRLGRPRAAVQRGVGGWRWRGWRCCHWLAGNW